jgi:uncharacterized membrane protein
MIEPASGMRTFFANIAKNLRNNLLAGSAVMAPIGVTVYAFNWLFEAVDAILGPQLNDLLARAFPTLVAGRIPGLGIAATLILLYITGSVTRSYLGSQIVRIWDRFIKKVPLFGAINMAVKQVTTAIASSGTQFRRVVFVRFPDENSYVIGFVTGNTEVTKGDHRRNVFIPTAPNPTTGILALMRPDQIIESDLSVEEAMKMVVSAGLVERYVGSVPVPPAR